MFCIPREITRFGSIKTAMDGIWTSRQDIYSFHSSVLFIMFFMIESSGSPVSPVVSAPSYHFYVVTSYPGKYFVYFILSPLLSNRRWKSLWRNRHVLEPIIRRHVTTSNPDWALWIMTLSLVIARTSVYHISSVNSIGWWCVHLSYIILYTQPNFHMNKLISSVIIKMW